MNQHPSYSKLDYDHREIRLLTIPEDDDDYLVRCTTRTVSLDGRPTSSALSYCWGDRKVPRQLWWIITPNGGKPQLLILTNTNYLFDLCILLRLFVTEGTN